MQHGSRLGEILVADGAVEKSIVDQALEAQLVYAGRIGTNLVELGCANLEQIGAALAQQYGVAQADAQMVAEIPPEILELVSADDCFRFGVLPIGVGAAGRLLIGMLDPSAPNVAVLATHLGRELTPLVVPELRFFYLLERYCGVPRAKRFLRMPDGGEKSPRKRRYLGATVRPATGDVALVTKSPGAGQHRDSRAARLLVAPVSRRTSEVQLPRSIEVPVRARPDAGGSDHDEDPAGIVYLDELPRVQAGRDTDIDLDVDDVEFIEARPAEAVIAELEQADTGAAIARLLVAPLFAGSGMTVLFWVRGKHAIACTAEGTSATDQRVQQLAVSLDTPSAFHWALRLRGVIWAPGVDDATQYQIASFLTTPLPEQVCVAPVSLGSKVVNLICVHSVPRAEIPHAVINDLRDVAEAAGRAYERLRDSIRR